MCGLVVVSVCVCDRDLGIKDALTLIGFPVDAQYFSFVFLIC